MTNNTTEQALALADQGFAVFPLVYGKKIPATKDGFYSATKDPDEIKKMFRGRFNIGIATGGASGIVVIDVDSYKDNGEAFKSLCGALGELPQTLTVKTRAGGWHFYFKLPDGLVIKSSNGVIAKGVDIKADGGYVVAPGSYVEADDKGPAGWYVVESEGVINE